MIGNSLPTRWLIRVVRTAVVCVTLVLVSLLIFQSHLIYHPQRTSPEEVVDFLRGGGQRLDYLTGQGHQTAWLLPARGGHATQHLWIVCAGNGSQALDMADLQILSGLTDDAFVLVDYPGYGVCEGSPNPARIAENLAHAVPLAARAVGIAVGELPTRGVVFGHSLGCAAALLGADQFGVRRAVLLSPFISTMEMTRVMLHVPLGWLVTHRFDNRARLEALKARGGHAWIFHGEDDDTIPLIMGKTLAAELTDRSLSFIGINGRADSP